MFEAENIRDWRGHDVVDPPDDGRVVCNGAHLLDTVSGRVLLSLTVPDSALGLNPTFTPDLTGKPA